MILPAYSVLQSLIVFGQMFSFPLPGRGTVLVLQRNFFSFSYALWQSVFYISLEPIVYLMAFGYGLGFYLSDILGVPYISFFALSLLCFCGLLTSFNEASDEFYERIHSKSKYLGYHLSPLNFKQILWSV